MVNTWSKLFAIIMISCSGQLFAYDYGDPTADEQAHLEVINRARSAPAAEAFRLDIDLLEGVVPGEIDFRPAQPLSFNAVLTDVARSHSADMLLRQFFGHYNPDGYSPFDRMTTAGYIYNSAGENIAIIGTTDPIDSTEASLKLHDNLFIDSNFPGRGHRINILASDYREIGVGLAYGDWIQGDTVFNSAVVTTNFGLRFEDNPILLGVVYDDLDNDWFYDAGEGVSGIDVDVLQTGDGTVTASAGGYGMEMTRGGFLVTFTHEALGSIVKTVQIEEQNVKVDALLSEFLPSNTPSQCATLTDDQLLVPCVTVGGRSFIADLSVGDADPEILLLNHFQPVAVTPTAQCAVYRQKTGTVHFPCIRMDDDTFRADYSLAASTPIRIRLDSVTQ